MYKIKIKTEYDLNTAVELWNGQGHLYDYLNINHDLSLIAPHIDHTTLHQDHDYYAISQAIKKYETLHSSPLTVSNGGVGNSIVSDNNAQFESELDEVLGSISNLLKEKNRKYGDAVLNPKRVFSRADIMEQINVRIDDKISRIMNRQDDDTEDAEWDLLGYLIIKQIAKLRKNKLTTE